MTQSDARVATVEVRASLFASEKRPRATGTMKAAERYKLARQSIAIEGNKLHKRRLRTQVPSERRSCASFQGCRARKKRNCERGDSRTRRIIPHAPR